MASDSYLFPEETLLLYPGILHLLGNCVLEEKGKLEEHPIAFAENMQLLILYCLRSQNPETTAWGFKGLKGDEAGGQRKDRVQKEDYAFLLIRNVTSLTNSPLSVNAHLLITKLGSDSRQLPEHCHFSRRNTQRMHTDKPRV